MRILLIEPFLGASHRQWAEGLKRHSRHSIEILGMKGRHWKWRMYGAAAVLAGRCRELDPPDLIIATDMIDVASFRGLLPSAWMAVPFLLYFHENQFVYPDSSRDAAYSWINFTSALAADDVRFNSEWNRSSFLEGAEALIRRMPDNRPLSELERVRGKCAVLPLGMDYSGLPEVRGEETSVPLLLWNHRWEEDKGITEFLDAVTALSDLDFRLLLLGERGDTSRWKIQLRKLEEKTLHCGMVGSREEYLKMTASANCLPVSSGQDFFGISVLEAVAAGVFPLLPKRLAYPEHFPCDLFPEVYYSGSLEQALRKYLGNPPDPEPELQKRALRYSWPLMIEEYDSLFERCAGQKR